MVVCSVDDGVDSALLSDLEMAVAAGEKNSSLNISENAVAFSI